MGEGERRRRGGDEPRLPGALLFPRGPVPHILPAEGGHGPRFLAGKLIFGLRRIMISSARIRSPHMST